MVSSRKKKQQNKRLFSKLGEADTDFIIGHSNHGLQTENRGNMVNVNTSSDNTNNPTQVNHSQVDVHTLEDYIVSKVQSEVDNVITTIETRVQDALLTAIENLVIPRVELALKSANASSGRSVDSNVLEPDQRDFSGNIEGLQMTALSRINSRTDSNRIDETRDNITVEEGDLLVNERNIDRQTHTHHSIISWKCLSTLFVKFFG